MINSDRNPLLALQQQVLCNYYILITAVVSLYWVVSISTVFINKTLLNSETLHLNAPLFVTWFQCFITTIICVVLKKTAHLYSENISFPDYEPFRSNTVKNILPLSILFVSMIGFNNLCLSYVDVSFYFVSRSLTTVFNVIFSYVILKQVTSRNVIACCAIIVVGFWLGVDQENLIGTFSFKGTVYGVLSSLFLSLYSIQIKKILPFVKQSIVLISFYNNLYSIILLVPLMYLNEEFTVLANYDFSNRTFWILMMVGGVCGFSIGFVTMLQIKVTSPLTHNISGTAKACAQTIIASVYYNEAKTMLWWLSNVIVLAGTAVYARVKQLEMTQINKPLYQARV